MNALYLKVKSYYCLLFSSCLKLQKEELNLIIAKEKVVD